MGLFKSLIEALRGSLKPSEALYSPLRLSETMMPSEAFLKLFKALYSPPINAISVGLELLGIPRGSKANFCSRTPMDMGLKENPAEMI